MFIGCCALLLAATGLHAQLTLTVDTITKTWWWTGSTSASGTIGGTLVAHITGGDGADYTYPIGNGHLNFSTTIGNAIVPFDDIFFVGPNGFYVDPIAWDASSEGESYNGTFTGQGSGSPNYYGDQSAEVIGYMAGWADGMTVYLNDAPVGSVSVIVAPVPEPSAYALAAGFAALGCAIARRRRLL